MSDCVTNLADEERIFVADSGIARGRRGGDTHAGRHGDGQRRLRFPREPPRTRPPTTADIYWPLTVLATHPEDAVLESGGMEAMAVVAPDTAPAAGDRADARVGSEIDGSSPR